MHRYSPGAVFQKRFKSGVGSTHLVDSANNVFLILSGVLNTNLAVVMSKIASEKRYKRKFS